MLDLASELVFVGDEGTTEAQGPSHREGFELGRRSACSLSTSLEMRYLGNRFADPDRHQTARGYTLFNWTGRYRYKDLEACLSIENLTNTDWREAQFFFTSRLPGEPAGGVPDIHFAPGTPRSFLGGLAAHF